MANQRGQNQGAQMQRMQGTLEKIQLSLNVTALIQLADEFYTKQQRSELYAQFRALEDEERRTLVALNESGPKDRLRWEEQVSKSGELGATEQLREREAIRQVRAAATDQLKIFRDEHRLLLQLLEAKKMLSPPAPRTNSEQQKIWDKLKIRLKFFLASKNKIQAN